MTTLEGGWAASSTDRSLRAAFVLACGAWQLVMVGATLGDRAHWVAPAAFVAMHLAYAGIAVATARERIPTIVFVALGLVLILIDLTAAESIDTVAAFSAVWMWNLFHLMPMMALRGRSRWIMAALEGIGLPIAVYLIHPEWTAQLPIAAFGTSMAMQSAAWFALRFFERLGDAVDLQSEQVTADRRTAEFNRVRSLRARESARVLHDTVINTLGAIASGGGATRDRALVQARCERDVETMAAFENYALDGQERGLSWTDLGLLGPVEFVRMSPAELDDWAVEAPVAAARGVRLVAQEAVLNAVKHGGTEAVLVLARRMDGGGLEVIVRDGGPGVPDQMRPGLSDSMLERARLNGIDVDVTTLEGVGTDVTISVTPPDRSRPTDDDVELRDVAGFVLGVRRRAGWAAALGTAAVGIVIELVNHHGRLTWTYGTIATVLLATCLTALLVRRRGTLPPWGSAMLVVAAPAAYFMTLPAVDFGRDHPFLWQAITVVPVVVLLLEFGRSMWPAVAALVGILATACVVSARLTAVGSTSAAAIVLVGVIAVFGIVAGWESFRRRMRAVSERAALDHEAAARTRLEVASRAAADEAMERWRAAGLHASLDLLRRIASGDADPAEPAVQAHCAEEEAFLRQLILLSPDSIHMNVWFHRVLSAAREGGIAVRVRTSDWDVESRATAKILGALLRRVVESAAHGDEVSVTFGETGGTTRLGIVGPRMVVRTATHDWSAPSGWQLSCQEAGEEAIVEVTS